MKPFLRRFFWEKTAVRGPLLLGLLGIGISVVIAYFVERMQSDRVEAVFLQTSSRLVRTVQNRIINYGEGLRRTNSFLGANVNKPSEFSLYVQFVDLTVSQPGVLSIGLIRQVPDGERASYQASWQKVFSNVSLKMATISSSNENAYIVESLEPRMFKIDPRGYDVSVDHDLVKDLSLSIKKDKNVIVRSKILYSSHHTDLFVFSPWYLLNPNVNRSFDRQGELKGFIYAPISVVKMMEGVRAEYSSLFEYSLYMGTNKELTNKLYDNREVSEHNKSDATFFREVAFDYGGKNFIFEIKTRPEFDVLYAKNDGVWAFIFFALTSFLLAIIYYLYNLQLLMRPFEKEKSFDEFTKNGDRLSQLGLAFIKTNTAGDVLQINALAEKVFKINSNDVFDGNICSVFVDLHQEELQKNILRCKNSNIEKENNSALKVKFINDNGKYFGLNLSLSYCEEEDAVFCILSVPFFIGDVEKIALQQRFEMVVDATQVGMWEWFLVEDKMVWDNTMHAIYGLNPHVFIVNYANWSTKILVEDLSVFDGAMHAMLHGGEAMDEVVRIVRADGEIRYISVHGQLILDEESKLEYVIGVNLDVTALKKAETSLRESVERFSLAAQAAKEGIWDWNMQTGEVWFSSQWKENFGYRDDELENNLATWDRLIEPDDRKRFLRLTHEFNQGGDDRFEATLRFRHKKGHWVSVRSRAVHLKNELGEVVRMVGSHEDITEILKHEEALNESRKRMDLTIQCAGLGVWDWNLITNAVLFGGQWAEMLGYSEDGYSSSLGGWAALTHPDDLIAAGQVIKAHLNGETPICAAEFRVRTKDGSWRWILCVGRVSSFSLEGEPLRMLGVNIDIHERKINEAALQAATLLAEAASRAKSEFLANMSHEIRTPLNAILGFSALIQESILNTQQRDFVDSIHTAGKTLLSLLNDLLDFSKIESGSLELECAEFDLRHICEEVLLVLTPKAYEKNLELACVVLPEIPERFLGDGIRLKQVILNMVNNAIKFTVQGSIVIRVHQQAINQNQAIIRLEVQDTGVGISEKVRNELFNPFTQADNSTTRKFGGTGLGLSICKRLIEAMGGQIGVESREGGGAMFWFEVPLGVAHGIMPPPVLNEHKSKRVLVIEAFAAHAESLQILLDRLGLIADCFADQEIGLAALDDSDAAYILVIVNEHSAVLSERIRAHPRFSTTPVIYLCYRDIGVVQAPQFDFLLSRPVQELKLRQCVEEALHLTALENKPAKVHYLSADEIGNLNLHILVAEDNPINQKVAMMMLQKLGCKVDVASNGLEALNTVQKGSYDLVFMDCQMPEMDGYTSVAMIRSLSGEQSLVPIVALTANAFKVDEERCYAVGMNDFIAKPISIEHLIRVLSRFFANQPSGQVTITSHGENMLPPISLEDVDKEMISINQTFEDLKKMLGMDMTDELIQLFLPTLDECLANLGAVIESGDGDAVVSCAHKLKGAAAQLGAQSLADLCKKVEQTGRENTLDEAWPYHAKIISLGAAVGQRLRDQ
jgi:PAS domain S-box-containing protein